CDKFALTEMLVSGLAEKARQISAVPICTLVRLTSDHGRPAPFTPVTLMPAELAPVETNANSNVFLLVVENAGEVILLLLLLLSFETTVLIDSCAVELKLIAVRFAPATVTDWLAGVKTKPARPGVTV